MNVIKQPLECQNLAEIRQAIDELDQQVIRLWAHRFEYVKAASKFKTSEAAVRDPERFAAMLTQRGQWAKENGLNQGVIEKLYHDLITYFIEEEKQHWKRD